LLSDAVARLRQLDNPAELVAVFQSALLACELGEMDRARDLAEECAALGRRLERPVALAAALHLRALVAARSQDAPTALRIMEEALDLERRLKDQQRLVQTLTELGHILLEARQGDHALDAFAEALQLARASGERVYQVRALEGLGRAIVDTDVGVAIQLAACADTWRELHAVQAWPSDLRRRKPYLAAAERTLGGNGFARAWASGRKLNVDEAVHLALATAPQVRAAHQGTGGEYHPLTPREQDVVVRVAYGLPNRVIAAELQVSTATVRVHLDHILAKLALHSRTQVAMWAIERGTIAEQGRRMRLNQAQAADTGGSETIQ
jgi:DNA-binding CsgD family transcriptional regulator